MLRTSNSTLMQSLTVLKVCLVADGVDVGRVGVMVAVDSSVGVNVAVGGSDVAEAVGDDSTLGEGVTVGVSGGLFLGMKIKAKRRIRPIRAGIPYLRN